MKYTALIILIGTIYSTPYTHWCNRPPSYTSSVQQAVLHPNLCSRQHSSSSLVQYTAPLILIGRIYSTPHPHWCIIQHPSSSMMQQTALLGLTGSADSTHHTQWCNRQHSSSSPEPQTALLIPFGASDNSYHRHPCSSHLFSVCTVHTPHPHPSPHWCCRQPSSS